MSGGSRVSIPSSVKKTIQNIKEIAGNHSDDEIYAMLKECNMDPNETAQKLLFQDTFHEVKRKRDKRKEISNNREPAESRWRPGMQGRGGRGGKGNYSSRYISHDAGGGRNVSAGKENGVNQVTERGIVSSSSFVTQETENKSGVPASSTLTGAAKVSTKGSSSQVAVGTGIASGEESSVADPTKSVSTAPSHVDIKNAPATVVSMPHGQPVLSSDQFLSSIIPASMSGVYASASDPVLVPSFDTHTPGVVGTIKREGGSQQTVVEPPINKAVSHDIAGSELLSSISEKAASKSQGYELSQVPDASQPLSSAAHSASSGSRPSSNYSSRSQQVIGPQKVGPSKEWKPKPTNPNPSQASGTIGTSDAAPVAIESTVQPVRTQNSPVSEETTSRLQKKLEELQFSDRQHVIFPNHLQVPEAERTGLSFGSFDASFGLGASFVNGSDSDKNSTTPSESSQDVEENAEEPVSSIQNASSAVQEEEYPDRLQSPPQMPENVSSREGDISNNISSVPEYDQSKQGALAPGGPQFPVIHTAPGYSTFGLLPPALGGQLAPFESSEQLQARDVARLPSFVVQQPFDASSYYTQIYRPVAEGDGRISPFLAPVATKYNGNVALLSSQTSQSSQESGNSLVLPTTGPTPLVSQAAGVMQSSIAVNQQPVPIFRQPAGVHISHYPPNYIPYSQYFSPFYVPSPTIHHFLSNTAFPQQAPSGSIYPPPAGAATTPVKYSLSHYKAGTNSGNSTHVGMPTGYGPYSSGPPAYSPSPAVTSGNSTVNEDLNASQYKENNIYISGQQSEGSAVWIPAPSRDIPGMQGSSFYNMPPQGQHMTFTPTQAGHGGFSGIYHPTQTVAAASVHSMLSPSQTMTGAVEMVGPPAGVYPQPQRPQINWANNY